MEKSFGASPVQDLLDQGQGALSQSDYAQAAAAYDTILKKYPSDPAAISAQLYLGISYLFANKPDEALVALMKAQDNRNPAEIRDPAFFYAAQAQFSQATALSMSDPKRAAALQSALATYAKHLADFPRSETREESYYGHAAVNYLLENYVATEKDILALLAEFPAAVDKPDYLLLVGSAYSTQANKLSAANEAATDVNGATKKAIGYFDQIKDTEQFAVVANEARMQGADLLFNLAETPEDYQKVIQLYQQVVSREALIPVQERLIERIRQQSAEAARARNFSQIQQLSRIGQRQRARLAELKDKPDALLLAMIRTAQVEMRLHRFDEARVLLRRVTRFADGDTKREASYFTILSYALQKATQQADTALRDHQNFFPNDPKADNISILIGDELLRNKDYTGAIEQFRKSLADYPNGRQIDLATVKLASALVALKQNEEAVKILTDFVAKKAGSPGQVEAQYNLALALADMKRTDEAVTNFRTLATNAKADKFQSIAYFQMGYTLYNAGRFDEAIRELTDFRAKFAAHEQAPAALILIGAAQQKKKDFDVSALTFEQFLKDYPQNALAANAADSLAKIYGAQNKTEQMVTAYQRVITLFPGTNQALSAAFVLAQYFEKNRQYDEAAKNYTVVADATDNPAAPAAQGRLASLWFTAAKNLGAYQALDEATRKEWADDQAKGEAAVQGMLTKFPQAREVSSALQELVKMVLLRVDVAVFTEEQAVSYFTALARKYSDPSLSARITLAQAGVSFERGRGAEALKIYEQVRASASVAVFGPEDLQRYGSALLAGRELDKALEIFQQLGANFSSDPYAKANAIYGQGAVALAKKQTAEADKFFGELEKTAPWSEKIIEAKYGRGLAAEERGEYEPARTFYQQIIQDPRRSATADLKAKALLGFARTLEKEGKLLPNAQDKTAANAVNNYLKVDALYESAKETAAEGLWRAGQIFEKANQPADARKAYEDLARKYPQSEFADQAKKQLGALPAKS